MRGGGFIGVGEPSAYLKGGRYFQLADLLGVDREMGFSQTTNRYNTHEVAEHFIWGEGRGFKKPAEDLQYAEPVPSVYAIDEKTQLLSYENNEVKMATRDVGKGRTFYLTGLPYNVDNIQILKNAIHYVSHKEDSLKKYYASHPHVEVAAYPDIKQFCVYNNAELAVESTVYDGDGQAFQVSLNKAELKWFQEEGGRMRSILRFILFYAIQIVLGFAIPMVLTRIDEGWGFLLLLWPISSFLGAVLMQWLYSIRRWPFLLWVLFAIATSMVSYLLAVVLMISMDKASFIR